LCGKRRPALTFELEPVNSLCRWVHWRPSPPAPLFAGVGFFQDRVPMRSSPHPPSPLLPHGEQGEPPQIPLPDAVRSPSPAQGEGFGVRAPAKTLHLQTAPLPLRFMGGQNV
jgi:hypothetical protein